MPDFDAALTSGTAIATWDDPQRAPGTLGSDDKGAPSRINPSYAASLLRATGAIATEIEITATVGGVVAPLDAALGGRLFQAWAVEWPGAIMPVFTSPAGQSSIQRFTPAAAGHYTIGIRREGGGAVILHVDVV